MYAVPELKVLQAVIAFEDFIRKFSGGDVFMLRSAYKVCQVCLCANAVVHSNPFVRWYKGISNLFWLGRVLTRCT